MGCEHCRGLVYLLCKDSESCLYGGNASDDLKVDTDESVKGRLTDPQPIEKEAFVPTGKPHRTFTGTRLARKKSNNKTSL